MAGLKQNNISNISDTTSLDLPQQLQDLLNYGNQEMQDPNVLSNPAGITTGVVNPNRGPTFQPGVSSFQEGGLVGEEGQAIRPQPEATMGAQDVEAKIQEFMTNNPDQVEQLKMAVTQAMQEEGVTPEILNQLGQLATVALNNPDMYPQLVQQAIQQGLLPPETSPEYDEGLIIMILVIGRVMGEQGGVQPPRGQQPMSMANGGPLPKTGGAIPITAHAGEYVIPKHVVDKKGTDFFDKMLGSK